jgi:adenylosuccinate synthase
VLARAVAGLGLYPVGMERLVDVVVGAQYGSEGKGNICAYLANEYKVLMRVGGPNAGHRVAHPPYDYVQIPSGTGSNRNAKILIGAGATIWIETILKEISDHALTPERLAIDPQAMIIEASDRVLESKTFGVIGSTHFSPLSIGVHSALFRQHHSDHRTQLIAALQISLKLHPTSVF